VNENRSPGPKDHHRYASGSDNAHWYWSCTQHRENASNVYDVDFTDGDDDWDHKDNNSLSGRVVRAELEAPFPILLSGNGPYFCAFHIGTYKKIFNAVA